MGFVSDFSPMRSQAATPPPQTATAQSTETPAPRHTGKRGFYADFNPEAAYAPQETFQPTVTPTEDLTPSGNIFKSYAPPTEDSLELDAATATYGSSSWELPKITGGSEVENLRAQLSALNDRLQTVSEARRGSESKVTELEGEISRTKDALSHARQSVSEKRQRYERSEKWLERNRRMVSRMEMRMSGYGGGGGWGRGWGGGHWHHSYNDEFLFSRDELRGPENEDERKLQMGLVLDSRRNKVWKLQDEVSNNKSAYSNAESKVRELEHKLDSLVSQLEAARRKKSTTSEEKTALENKIRPLKERYQHLSGRLY